MNNYLGGFLLEENACFVSEWCSDGTLYCLTTVCSPVGAEKYSSPREGQKGVFITSPPYSALLATDLYTMHYNSTSSTPSDKKNLTLRENSPYCIVLHGNACKYCLVLLRITH